MGEHAEVVVVGAGIVGASIAYHLAARGCRDVIVLEQAEVEVAGSTARSAAGVRHQFSSRTNVLLSLYSIERFRRFAEELGADSGLRQHGYLLLVSDPAAWPRALANVELQRGLGVAVEVLRPDQVAAHVPGTHTADLQGATFCAADGTVDPHGVAMGYLRRARELGVVLHRARPATGFQLAGGRVVAVETPAGPITCATVVNAAGAWAGAVAALAGLDVPVRPFRRNVYVTEPFAALPRNIPLTVDVASGFWLRKEHDAVIFGLSRPDEPPSFVQTVDWDWLDHVLEAGLARFPPLENAGLARRQCWAGLYEITPDHMPVLGRMPGLPSWINAAGFSGHGVMHSPATGLLMAEEALDGQAHSIDIAELRIERFAGQLHAEQNVY